MGTSVGSVGSIGSFTSLFGNLFGTQVNQLESQFGNPVNTTLAQGTSMIGAYEQQSSSAFGEEESMLMQMMGGITGGILGGAATGSSPNGITTLLPTLGSSQALTNILAQLQQGQPAQGLGSSGSSSPANYDNGGTLSQQKQGGPITYTDHSGWTITVTPNGQNPTITITSPDGKQSIAESGISQSGTNGTAASNQTLELPDGTVVNLTGASSGGGIQSVGIFDGQEQVNLNAQQGAISNVDYNPSLTRQNEAQLPTGNIDSLSSNGSGTLQLTQMQQAFDPYTQISA